jgi:hypothetical protein
MIQEKASHQVDAPERHKSFTIIVNGRRRTITDHKLTYIEAVHLAYPGEQPSETVSFTVTYSNPHGKDGSLVEGQEVKVQDGMVLNVRKTDRS